MTTYDLTLVTADPLPEPDGDLLPLFEAATEAGLRTRIAVWDDPAVNWAESRLTLLRSTWDYYQKVDAFRRWIGKVSRESLLLNPRDTLLENLHKSYLLRLPLQGIAVIPTVLVEKGTTLDLSDLASQENWERIVMKPAISAGSFETYFFDAREVDQEIFEGLVAKKDVLIQPYMKSVEDYGERSLLFFDRQFSHCVRKAPRFEGQEESISGPYEPAEEELILARKALHTISGPLPYARVDIISNSAGEPLIAELELMEPSLFFSFAPESLPRFLEVLKSYL